MRNGTAASRALFSLTKTKPYMRRILTFAFTLLLCSHTHASPANILDIEIDGRTARIELTHRQDTENKAFAHGAHFRGQVAGMPGSWARLSRIDGQWQGLVSTGTGLHVIEPGAGKTQRARALDAINAPFACGADHDAHAAPQTLRSAVRETIGNFDQLCEDAIDGVCAGVELELAFDQAFVSEYESSYQAQAASLLNMVEGFYLDGLGIRFNTLSMTFLDRPVFADQASSTDYLNEVRVKKQSGALAFVKNPRAILHVVRGSDFSDTGTAGIAWVGGLCNGNGYSSGATALYRPGGSDTPSISLTALITTHEIGHNLGAKHDNTPEVNCPSGYFMDSMVNPYVSEFSSCSKSAIKGLLGDLSGWRACTNYPVKISVDADPANTLSLSAPEAVVHRFDVDYIQGYETQAGASLEMSLEGAAATNATLNGVACQINGNADLVTCPLSGTAISSAAITVEPRWALATLVLQPNLGNGGDLFNVAVDDGRYEYQLATDGPAAPTDMNARIDGFDVTLRWRDNTSNEIGFEIQRRTAGGRWAIVGTTAGNVTEYRDTLVTEGSYEYRVLAMREDIYSAPSEVVSVSTSFLPEDREKRGGSGGGVMGIGALLIAGAIGLIRRRTAQR